MSTPIQPWTSLVVAVAGWTQRDQQAAIVYLLEEKRVLKARLRGRKLRFADEMSQTIGRHAQLLLSRSRIRTRCDSFSG